MSDDTYLSRTVKRLRCSDTITWIYLDDKRHNDEKIAEMIDCLLTYPNFVTRIHLGSNSLTDKTGLKLARYVATSSTIRVLSMSNNQLSEATYLALAAALKINTSLHRLYLLGNQPVNRNLLDAAFVDALILNPNRPDDSTWQLYFFYNEFQRLKTMAEELGHPSMQSLLAMHLVMI